MNAFGKTVVILDAIAIVTCLVSGMWIAAIFFLLVMFGIFSL